MQQNSTQIASFKCKSIWTFGFRPLPSMSGEYDASLTQLSTVYTQWMSRCQFTCHTWMIAEKLGMSPREHKKTLIITGRTWIMRHHTLQWLHTYCIWIFHHATPYTQGPKQQGRNGYLHVTQHQHADKTCVKNQVGQKYWTVEKDWCIETSCNISCSDIILKNNCLSGIMSPGGLQVTQT